MLEYRVQLTRPGTTGWTFNQTIEARGRSLVTLPHLHAFTVYEVQVSAINSAGIGPPSAPVQFQTHEEVPAGPVRHVQAEAKSSRSALVSWLVRIHFKNCDVHFKLQSTNLNVPASQRRDLERSFGDVHCHLCGDERKRPNNPAECRSSFPGF